VRAEVNETKREVIKGLVDSCSVVRLYIDPRGAEVSVPQYLKAEAWACLDIGLPAALARPIQDLAISSWGVHGTLSFGGAPHYCAVPYEAIHGARHQTSGGLVSWHPVVTGALQQSAPVPVPAAPAPVPGAQVIDMAAWRRARGR
jgi:hypothetical protein